MHIFDNTILRKGDIRGIYGKTLHDLDAYYLAKGLVTFLLENSMEAKKIVIGRDGRISSPALYDQLIKGLLDSGVAVTSIGITPSPVLYFAHNHLSTDAGIIITASHNPAEYNGFKIICREGVIMEKEIQRIAQIAKDGKFRKASDSGSLKEVDIKFDYIARILKDIAIKRKDLKVAWDCGNGTAGVIIENLVKKLPGKHYVLYAEVDGTFPNHHPDPSEEKNMLDLIKTVKEKGCDIGFGFDGDSDRLGIVDEKGKLMENDRVMMILTADIASKNPGSKMIIDVKASRVLSRQIVSYGAEPIICPSGHSFIKNLIKNTKAIFGGEISGHIFFNDKYYGFDDGIYSAIRTLDILAAANKKLSAIDSSFPDSYVSHEYRINAAEEYKFQIIDNLIKLATEKGYPIKTIDGVIVEYPYGWFLVRASNTQAAITARCETDRPEDLPALEREMKQLIINASQGHIKKID